MRWIIVVGILFALFSPQAKAQGSTWPDQMTVKMVFVNNIQGIGYVKFDKDPSTSQPACAIKYPRSLSFSLKTDEGKAMLSFVLTAYVSGKKVRAQGRGYCIFHADLEDLGYIWFSEYQ